MIRSVIIVMLLAYANALPADEAVPDVQPVPAEPTLPASNSSGSSEPFSSTQQPAAEYSPMPGSSGSHSAVNPIAEELGEFEHEHTGRAVHAACEECDEEEDHRFRLRASADYLYMKPRRQSLAFAIVDPRDDLSPQGSIESITWGTESGYRVSLIGDYGSSGWFVNTSYFYLHSSGSRSAVAPGGGTLYGLLAAPSVIGGEYGSSNATSNVDIDIVDVSVGKSFNINRSLSSSLFVGPRFGHIDQEFQAVYQGSSTTTFVSSPQRFDGIGLAGGGTSNFHLGKNVSLFGGASAALIVGDQKSWLRETSDGGTTFTVNLERENEVVIPVIDLSAGVEMRFSYIHLAAGYQVSEWFDLIDAFDTVELIGHPGKLSQSTGNLSISGLFIRLTASF
jgi:hypothetical protein